MVLLEPRHIEALEALAKEAYPEEFCAILLGRGEGDGLRVVEIVPVANVDERPRGGYAIAPAELIAAEKAARPRGLRIVGFAHSHPGGEAAPSARDVASAFWPECVYGVVGVEGVRWWRMREGAMEEVEARIFANGSI